MFENVFEKNLSKEETIKEMRKKFLSSITELSKMVGNLDGFTEDVFENIKDYDDIFKRLYDKFHNCSKGGPSPVQEAEGINFFE